MKRVDNSQTIRKTKEKGVEKKTKKIGCVFNYIKKEGVINSLYTAYEFSLFIILSIVFLIILSCSS